MYLIVKDLVPKCTESYEGNCLYDACIGALVQKENVRISFSGIGNVTEDFLFAFLGSIKKSIPKDSFKNISYVRIESHIFGKIKATCKALDS